MKEIIYEDKLIYLESDYIKNYNPYLIEEGILRSFGKRELKDLIENTIDLYLREKLSYNKNKQIIKKKYKDINDISKLFIYQFEYYFVGGEEIDLIKHFIDRLTRFYKVNYEMNKSYKKRLDIKTIPISEIISKYVKIPDNLKRNIKCVFPDHRDKTASFKIYEHDNTFYCFGCHKGGNILNFISDIEGITTKEAYKKLLNLYY